MTNIELKESIASSINSNDNKEITGDILQKEMLKQVDYSDTAAFNLFIDMWNLACGPYGEYNGTTKFFELNGIVDIAYEEALEIYEKTKDMFLLIELRLGYVSETPLRTNLPARTLWYGAGGRTISLYMCKIKKLCFRSVSDFPDYNGNGIRLYGATTSINVCNSSTTEVDGIIDFLISNVLREEYSCDIEKILFKNLRKGASLPYWSKLTNESVLYMITTAGNTTPITFTFHADVYARAIADEAIVAKVLEKNITLISA